MLAWRSAVGNAPVTDEWSDSYSYAFGRGDYGFVVLNAGTDTLERTFETSLAPGTYVDAISGGDIVVAGDGTFTASIPGMAALAISVADGPRAGQGGADGTTPRGRPPRAQRSRACASRSITCIARADALGVGAARPSRSSPRTARPATRRRTCPSTNRTGPRGRRRR